MKIEYKGKRKKALHIAVMVALPILCTAAVFSNAFIPSGFADYYCTEIFPYISVPMQSINMFFQYSLTENLIICLAPLAFIGLIFWAVILVKKSLSHGVSSYLYKSFRNLLVLILVGAISFQLMHGINYKRTHVSEALKLTDEELTYEDYCNALKWAYIGMLEARSRLGEDYNGVAHMEGSFENSATYACSLLNAFSDEYEVPLSHNYVRAKPVSMSHYWSYTHIVGMYDMFLAEVNLNTDYMSINEYPITLCHELCHAKGYAGETDCNVMATLACCSSARADFRYAGYNEIFWNLLVVTNNIAEKTGEDIPDIISVSELEPVIRDLQASTVYWNQIDDEVDSIKESMGIDITKTSNEVNDAFLKTNGETGIDSYKVPDSVYVRFYLTYAGTEDV